MSKNKVGRPGKIDKELMNKADIVITIIVIVLLLLLSLSFLNIISPGIYESIKASIANLFK